VSLEQSHCLMYPTLKCLLNSYAQTVTHTANGLHISFMSPNPIACYTE